MASNSVKLIIPKQEIVYAHLCAEDFPERYAEEVERISRGIIDEEVRGRVKSTLGSFDNNPRNLVQSSPYRLVVLQAMLPAEKNLISRLGLETAKKATPDFMSGFYVDCGLNVVPLKTGERINPVQTRVLESDLKSVGISLDDSRLVPYHVLIHEVNEKSPCGLVFRLSEEGKDMAKTAILHTDDFAWNYKSNSSGLFRACLVSGGPWYCGSRTLESSSGSGGVVVESAEGTSPKILNEIAARRKTAKVEYLAKLRAAQKLLAQEIATP